MLILGGACELRHFVAAPHASRQALRIPKAEHVRPRRTEVKLE